MEERISTAARLKALLAERGLKQADVLRMSKPFCEQYKIKLNKSDLSQFISGEVEPGQSKLFILGVTLNVSEAWLMGLDVPMERQTHAPEEQPPDSKPQTTEAKILAAGIDKMPEADRKRAIEMMYLMFDHYFPKRTEDNDEPK